MQQCRLSSWHKSEGPSKQTSTITVSVPRVSISIITKRRHHQKKQCCDIGKKNNIKLLIGAGVFHFEMAEMLSWWFWVQYFFRERHFKCPLLFFTTPVTCSVSNTMQFNTHFTKRKLLSLALPSLLTISHGHALHICWQSARASLEVRC